MRILAILLVLSAHAVLAQSEAPQSLGGGETVLTLYGGYGGGFIGAATVGLLVSSVGASTDAALVTGVIVYPLATAAATYGIGQAFGGDGTLSGTLAGAVVGAGVGAGLAVLAGTLAVGNTKGQPSGDVEEFFFGALGGLGVLVAVAVPYALGPPIGAMIGFYASLQPSAMPAPDGTAAPGVTLLIRF